MYREGWGSFRFLVVPKSCFLLLLELEGLLGKRVVLDESPFAERENHSSEKKEDKENVRDESRRLVRKSRNHKLQWLGLLEPLPYPCYNKDG